MTTITFIIWPASHDTAFRAAYAQLTGESVQELPDTNQSETAYLIGSARALPEHGEALKAAISSEIVYGIDPATMGWAPKIWPE